MVAVVLLVAACEAITPDIDDLAPAMAVRLLAPPSTDRYGSSDGDNPADEIGGPTCPEVESGASRGRGARAQLSAAGSRVGCAVAAGLHGRRFAKPIVHIPPVHYLLHARCRLNC